MKSYLSELLRKRSSQGFTLIELLIVITIIAALAIGVFVALNPGKRVVDARNATRTSDVNTILTAIHTSIVDNAGTLPTGLATSMLETQIGTGDGATCSPVATGGCSVAAATACTDLATNTAAYLSSNPIDPTGGTTWTVANTGYTVAVDGNNIVTIKACGKEGATNPNISASR